MSKSGGQSSDRHITQWSSENGKKNMAMKIARCVVQSTLVRTNGLQNKIYLTTKIYTKKMKNYILEKFYFPSSRFLDDLLFHIPPEDIYGGNTFDV